jgi:hypothetical protein
VEDDVGVHVVRRCSARLAPASALALWGVGRGLSARDACVDAAAQERRARHEARHMCGEATSPSSSSSAITSPVVKQANNSSLDSREAFANREKRRSMTQRK